MSWAVLYSIVNRGCTHWYVAGRREWGRTVLRTGRITVTLCSRIDGEGSCMLRHRVRPCVLLPGVGVLAGQPILRWGRGVLCRGVRLSHGLWGGWCLLVTLETGRRGKETAREKDLQILVSDVPPFSYHVFSVTKSNSLAGASESIVHNKRWQKQSRLCLSQL